MSPKFTDEKRFRLPYANAATTEQPGYLAARFIEYQKLDDKSRENVKPIRGKRAAAA